MEVTLKPKSKFELPVDGNHINPDEFSDKDLKKIAKIPALRGSTQLKIDDLFEVGGNTPEGSEKVGIKLEGNMSKVRWIGHGMSKGKIEGTGNIGTHLGAFMKGGEISVEGNVGLWAGQQMTGGEISIKENAGNFLGSTYRGDWRGMSGGKIVVEENAGDEVGEWMRGGSIEIMGDVGSYLGVNMKGGVIVVHGDAGDRLGAQMTSGKIAVMGKVNRLLPGFKFEEEVKDDELDGIKLEGKFLRFSGDLAEGGGGNLFVSKDKNRHLLSSHNQEK